MSSELEVALGELRGRLEALEARVERLADRIASHVSAPAPASDPQGGGWKTAATFVSAVVVPILVAIVGGYFALRAAGLR